MKSSLDDIDREQANALIVAIANSGDRAAFARLFEKFAPLVKSSLRRSGSSDAEAEELAQETLLTVWRKAHQFDAGRAAASTWIFTIARNLRIDVLRRRPANAALPEAELHDAPSPYDMLAERDAVARLHSALANLPSGQAEVVRAAYAEHHSHTEIAERLGLPLGTVKSRLRLALQRLRLAIEALP